MSAADLCRSAAIVLKSMTKLRRDEVVTLPVLDRICDTLGADYGDIMEHIGGGKTNDN